MLVAIDAIGIRGHGGAAVLVELLRWLPRVRPGWQFHVFLLERDLCEFELPDDLPGVTVTRTREGDSRSARMNWVNNGFPARVKAMKADVAFAFANIGARQPSCQQVVFCQQAAVFDNKYAAFWKIDVHLRLAFMRKQFINGFAASRAVIVQTTDMRDRMLQYYRPAAGQQIHVIPSGCRTPSENPLIREEIKQKIAGTSLPRLVYISHPWKHKNITNLVNALPEILRHFPQASLLLTLDENRKSRTYAGEVAKILRAAHQAGVTDKVIMLGTLQEDEVEYALCESDLLVFPSTAESFGLGLVEAMAANCPIAVADLPYAHDVAGDAACYFDPHSPAAIATCVIALLRDREKMAALCVAGEVQRQQYDYRIIAEKFARVFEDAVNE
ncbi:MAG: glycosyltransferase [bacterium]